MGYDAHAQLCQCECVCVIKKPTGVGEWDPTPVGGPIPPIYNTRIQINSNNSFYFVLNYLHINFRSTTLTLSSHSRLVVIQF